MRILKNAVTGKGRVVEVKKKGWNNIPAQEKKVGTKEEKRAKVNLEGTRRGRGAVLRARKNGGSKKKKNQSPLTDTFRGGNVERKREKNIGRRGNRTTRERKGKT